MKHSLSSLFNNSQNIKNKNFNIRYGFNNSNNTRNLNNSNIDLKFPRIIIKTRNERMSNMKNHENKTQYNDITNSCYNTINLLKNSFKILNLSKKNNSTILLNRNDNKKLIFNLRYNKDNSNLISEKDNTTTLKSISSIYNNYHTFFNKTNTDYDNIFLSKSKMTNYKKCLSSDYEKDNKSVIDFFGTKYKQKTDSILNIVQNKDGFYIKGLRYKKYFFYPHKKMNILSFHHNIMSKNIKKFEKEKKVENMKKIKHFEKLCKRNKEIIEDIRNNKNNNYIYNIIKQKKINKKKLKKKRYNSSQEIEYIINEEYNKAINSIDN